MARILIVEDENILRKNMVDKLRAEGHDLYEAAAAESALQLALLLAPDLILTDLRLPGIDGIELLKQVKAASPRIMIVVMTALGTQQSAIEAVREGAYDYLNKPVELKELVLLVNRAVSHSRALDRVQQSRSIEQRHGTLDQIVSVAPATREIKNRVRQLVASPILRANDPPVVLITGETGVGKTLLAHAIHNEGPRRDESFLTMNCAAAGEAEIERELFGNPAGAAANPADKGILQLADGGTVFLEEIDALPERLQSKLLAAIEGRSHGPRFDRAQSARTNVHFIVTSSRRSDLAGLAVCLVPELYHRINRATFHLPPLRDRREDIAPLAERFLTIHARRVGASVPELTVAAVERLTAYDWPGNARELSHVMERAVLVCGNRSISAEDLAIKAQSNHALPEIAVENGSSIHFDLDKDTPTLDEFERRVILSAHRFFNGDVARVAAKLGISAERVSSALHRDSIAAPAKAIPPNTPARHEPRPRVGHGAEPPTDNKYPNG